MGRTVGIEVLLSCALSGTRRKHVAKLLTEPVLNAMLDDMDADEEARAFPLGLLLASLCDLNVPNCGEPLKSFGDFGHTLWARTAFFKNLTTCLGAALRKEPW